MNGPTAKPTPEPAQLVTPLLLPEALGFAPQLLLDDIINVSNNAVQDGVNGMEEFLQKWADQRAEREGGDWDSTQEVEQGLVAFQTLLEYHTDIAFDFFEAWSLRNIFAIPPDLPIVLPHHANLDLTQTPQREQELMNEAEELRKQIDNQRRVRRTFTRALHVSNAKRRRAEKRLGQLSFLHSPSLDVLHALPAKLTSMYGSVSTLPPLDPATIASLTQIQLTDPGKRQWETNKTGYVNWAISQLLAKAKEDGGIAGASSVDVQRAKVDEVGSAAQLRAAFEAMASTKADLKTVTVSEDDIMEE